MNNQIDNIIRNTQRHQFDDGLSELFLGALTFLGGVVLLIPASPFQAGIWFFIGAIVIARFQEWLRQRYIYPRSGYVLYREHKSELWKSLLGAAIAIILVMAVLGIAFYLDFDRALQWASLVVGGFIGLEFLWKGVQLRLPRLVVLGSFSILVGVIVSPLLWSPEKAAQFSSTFFLGVYLFLFGMGAIASGGIRLRQHLRENPLLEEPIDE